MYESLARSHPKLERGIVWCLTCGNQIRVAAADCLEHGWPKCCEQTMSLDSPKERAQLVASAGASNP